MKGKDFCGLVEGTQSKEILKVLDIYCFFPALLKRGAKPRVGAADASRMEVHIPRANHSKS